MKNQLNPQELQAAREWITECAEAGCWSNLGSAEEVNNLSDSQIENGIAKEFSGGIPAFKQSFD